MSTDRPTERIAAARGAEAGDPAVPRHPDVALWRTATADDIDAIHAVMVAADKVDHPTWTTPRADVVDSFDLPHITHERDTIIGWDADRRPVAFGSAFRHPAREGIQTVHLFGAVLPELWRRGIGAQVLEWLVARGLQQLAEVAPTLHALPAGESWTAELKAFSDEANVGIPALAERFGFTAERWFTTMLRDLIGVVRDQRRRGLAPPVISATLQAIAAAGLEKAVLDVDTASPTGANTLYEGLGFAAAERSIAFVRHV
ncbi:MAG: hypothetical protein QM622_11325 [Microbacterium sp.]